MVIYKIDGPGFASSTVTLAEWREADIIINDKHMIVKDTSSDAAYHMPLKREKATSELLEAARMIKHVFAEEDDEDAPGLV